MELQYRYQNLIITNGIWTSTDALFTYYHIGKKTRCKYYEEERIHINGQSIKMNTKLQTSDRIEIRCRFDVDQESCIPCFDELHILYEDELFLIVDKPVHMIVHSDGARHKTTLYDLVKGYYMQQGYACAVRAIHRLDEETSGAVIFCKIPFFQPLLDHMLKEKEIQRYYTAICSGIIQEKTLCIQAAIGRDRHHNSRMRISSSGKEARTDVRVIKRYRDYTHVECRLHNGRTHQIRVHMASIHHPLLHDVLYGNEDERISRTALHAHHILLFHPLTQKQMTITCPLPEDMTRLLE